MRYHDILLEYSRDKTLSNFEEPLRKNMKKWFYNGDTIDWNMAEVLGDIEGADPTPNKTYVVWIIRRLLDGGIQRWEDLAKTKEFISSYQEMKDTGYLRRNPELRDKWADIGRIKTLSGLGRIVMQYMEAKNSGQGISHNTSRKAAEDKIMQNEVTVVVNTSTFSIMIPKTYEASKLLGRSTQWCTAMATTSQYFSEYSAQGPLYVVLDKANNRRWQLHFESAQFMDEHDDPIREWTDIPFAAAVFKHIDASAISSKARVMLVAQQAPVGDMADGFDDFEKTVATIVASRPLGLLPAKQITPTETMTLKVAGLTATSPDREIVVHYAPLGTDIAATTAWLEKKGYLSKINRISDENFFTQVVDGVFETEATNDLSDCREYFKEMKNIGMYFCDNSKIYLAMSENMAVIGKILTLIDITNINIYYNETGGHSLVSLLSRDFLQRTIKATL